MATPTPPGGGGSTTPPKNPKWKQLLTRGAVQGFNKFRRPLARLAVKLFLKPEQIAWIAAHENEIDSINTMISAATPSEGLWELTDDFQQDFVHEVILVCKEEASGAPATGTATAPAAPATVLPVFNETLERNRLVNAMVKLSDPRPFDDWFGALSADNQERLLRHIAQLSDTDLLDLIKKDSADLDVLLPRLPALPIPPTPPPPRLTYPQLRAAIAADTALSDKVRLFLARNAATVEAKQFWNCVERKSFNTLDEFRAIMSLRNNEIISQLRLIPVSAKLGQAWDSVKDVAVDGYNRAKPHVTQAVTDLKKTRDSLNNSPTLNKFAADAKARRTKWADKLKGLKS